MAVKNKTDEAIDQIRVGYSDAGEQRHKDLYQDGNRCLHFVTSEKLDAIDAARAVSVIQQYNRFEASKVIKMIQNINDLDPKAEFVVGREGSPVMYVVTDELEGVMKVLENGGSQPDELWETDGIGGSPEYCRCEDRIVDADNYPEAEGRSVVRAWWD